MAFHSEASPDSGARQSVKAHLLASQKRLVESLYNLEPLLDSVLSDGLLSVDNYQAVKAEKTPKEKARKLLEVVQCQLDERQATRFVACLKDCRKHYPRLRTWLHTEPNIIRGPTELQLQAQFSCLCSRLGSSVLTVSLALFSSGMLTQFELEQIQAAPTRTQQTETLLLICLSKGETTCKNFYSALKSEDSHLAEEINVSTLAESPSLLSSDTEGVAMPVEETRQTTGSDRPYSGLLQQVWAQLGVAAEDETRLNVCKLGVAVGLPPHTVRECLLEGVNIEDAAQLEALVSLFMNKTQDADRLLSRMGEIEVQRLQLSERGCLLLKLLQHAETLLRSESPGHLDIRNYLHNQADLYNGKYKGQSMVCTILTFLLSDCLAEAVEEPDLKSGSVLADVLQLLQGCSWVEPVLLQELEYCLTEGGTENLLQSVRVLAQILRDLHQFGNCLRLSKPTNGLYSCRPGRLHRVTSFQGVPVRVIHKVLNGIASASWDTTLGAEQYRQVCVNVARLLETQNWSDFANALDKQVVQHIRHVLSQPRFSSQAFDAGLRHRLLLITEFNPDHLGLGSLMQLHQKSLSDLQQYLKPNDHHNFQFVLESIQMLGESQLILVNSVRGLIAIDNGAEEVFMFKTSDPVSFLVRLHCIGYENGQGRFKVCVPRCALASQFKDQGLEALRQVATDVLAEKDDLMWLREGENGWWVKIRSVAKRHAGQIQDFGCCFKVTTYESECEVKFIYRDGKLQAMAERGCEVL